MSRRFAAVVAIASALLLGVAPASAGTRHRSRPVALVDSLNAPSTSVFSDRDLGAWSPIWAAQSLGPQFTVTRTTVLAQVGAFANAYAPNYPATGEPPFSVEIRRADADGLPADGDPLAVAAMTDDHDVSTWRYESAGFRLRLRPGTYFALVRADVPAADVPAFPGGVLLSTTVDGAVGYLADTLPMGVRDPVTAERHLTTGRAAFRVVGCVRAHDRSGRTHAQRARTCHRLR